MSIVSLRQAEIPGIRPLYADLLYNFSGVKAFYPHPPSLEAARTEARGVRLEPSHRRSLVDELRRQNEGCGAATLANLDRLTDPSTVVVATGQQVGMLGGPVFTLYKALTAVKCAAELTRRGTPAVPVFWLATEDHDVEEVNHSWTLPASGAPVRLEAVTQGEPGAAVGNIRVVDFRLDTFEEVCAELPFAAYAAGLARETSGAAFGFGDAFRALYQVLLEPYGIVFLCPMQPGIRRLAAPLLRRAIERAPQLTDALLQRGLTLQAAGYHQQVNVQASTSLVLLFEDSARIALKRLNGVYLAESRAYTPQELLVRVDRAPLDVSPSALLRPVMQDFLLPTAALVAGPSEAAYLGQASVLYESLLGRMPVVLPRATFTVVDDLCRKILRRYGLTATDCLVPRQALETAIARAIVPPPLQTRLQSGRDRIQDASERITAALRDFDPTLAASFSVSSQKIEYQLDKIQHKVAREALRRGEAAQRQAARLANFLYPNQHLQERVSGTLPMLARFGPSFVERIGQAIEPESVDHRILQL